MFIWDQHYRQLVCDLGERTLTKVRLHGKPAFVYPIGCGPLRPAIESLRAYARAKEYPFLLRGITEKHRELLEQEFPGCFCFCEEEKYADYIYEAQKLSTYSGKALHGKKNHCNRFEAEHEWSFVPLTRELIPACEQMLSAWTEDNAERLDESSFSFGEMTSSDTFNVHVEKAAADVNGAYPMVCRELVRMLMEKHPELVWINREDDMGLESLRKSKESYKPAYLLKKYAAQWIGEE